jgi:tetratricopeptide (TPR) repeat protein
VLVAAGRDDEAEPLLQAAWDSDAGRKVDVEVAEALARVAMQRFELGLANEVLDRWAREAPADPKPLLWLAKVKRRDGAGRDAVIACFENALRRDPTSDVARLGIAELQYTMGRYRESAAAYTDYAARRPGEAAGHIGVGLNALKLGDESLAATSFDRALSLDPDNTLALKERASLDLRSGNPRAALTWLERAVSVDPFDPELAYQESLVLARLGRSEEAKRELDRSLRLRREHTRMGEVQQLLLANPRDIPLRIEAARWMIEHGRAEEGCLWARGVTRDQPDNAEANRLLADFHQGRGELGLANHYRLHAGTRPASSADPPPATPQP